MSLLRADARALPIAAGVVQCVVTSPPYWGAQRDYGMAGQIGMETTPEAFVSALGDVFDGVRRVLRDDGVCWLNMGDSYAASGKGGGGSLAVKRGTAWAHRTHLKGWRKAPPGYKQKDLVGVPWLLAFELRRRGWYLRRDIVWEKGSPNEPTRADRPTGSHEIVFLLAKSLRYGFDPKALPHGSVWRITTDGSYDQHTATMPEKLAERCILAGSRPGDLVLDPFLGSGTVARCAISLGRRAVGCDLNPAYLKLADERTQVTRGLPLEVA